MDPIGFYNGMAKIGTGTISSGVASFTPSFSKAKNYTIKAKYPGDVFHKLSSAGVKRAVLQQ